LAVLEFKTTDKLLPSWLRPYALCLRVHELDDMLSQREKLNEKLKVDLDIATDPWELESLAWR